MFIQRLRASPWAVLGVMYLGLFMVLLDTTIVNIAVPSIIGDWTPRSTRSCGSLTPTYWSRRCY